MAKRRYVETLQLSPSKDQLWTELQELNARLIASEQETQRVKAVMSRQCASTLQIQMGQFRVAAGRFKQLAHETMENEQNLSKMVYEQQMTEMSTMLDDQGLKHELEHAEFKHHVERLEEYANS